MDTPYAYKTTAPAYPDFIADVLEVAHEPDVPAHQGFHLCAEGLVAIRDSLAARSDEPLNRYAERYFHAGQS